MKNAYLYLIAAVMLIAGCDYDEMITTNHEVQFKIGISNAEVNPSRVFSDNIEVDLTLTSGGDAFELNNIHFTKTGDDYVSDPIPMVAGDYVITDIVVDDHTIDCIPLESGAFRLDQNMKSTVQIADVAARTKGGKPLLITVYVEENGKKKRTDATASISLYYDEVIKTYALKASTNHILFTEDLDTYYTLTIEKEGYWPAITYFSYNQLEKKRLDITLLDSTSAPGPAIDFQPNATVFYMRLQFMDTGSVVLDWRNGDPKETIAFAVDPDNEAGTAFFSRDMGYVTGIPAARITGDVHLVKGIYFDAPADGLDVRQATGLQILSLDGEGFDSLDLSANDQLTSVSLSRIYAINVLTLPEQHRISNLQIASEESSLFPTESQLDYIINNVYTNAVARNILSGTVTLSGVSVSAASVIKLSQLESNYGWTVTY